MSTDATVSQFGTKPDPSKRSIVEHRLVVADNCPAEVDSYENSKHGKDRSTVSAREHFRVKDDAVNVRFTRGPKRKRLRLFSPSIRCRVLDISIGGMCIESGKPLKRREAIVVYIANKKRTEMGEHALMAEVVHRHVVNKKTTYRYGIRFMHIPPVILRMAIHHKSLEKKLRQQQEDDLVVLPQAAN